MLGFLREHTNQVSEYITEHFNVMYFFMVVKYTRAIMLSDVVLKCLVPLSRYQYFVATQSVSRSQPHSCYMF